MLGLIKYYWLVSGGVYGYCKIMVDLCELGEMCSCYCVFWLMWREGLCVEVGYGSKFCYCGGLVGVVVNILNWEFVFDVLNRVWVIDIMYI